MARQYLEDGFYPSGSRNAADSLKPSGALMKALMINGTRRDATTPDNNVGWGRVWLENSLMFDPATDRHLRLFELRHDRGLSDGESDTYSINMPSTGELTATLVWFDPAALPSAAQTLINDLDLSMTGGGNTYLGNNFAAGISLPTGTADSINTVEGIHLNTATAGDYTITVNGSSVPGNAENYSDRQGYALAVSYPACVTSIAAVPTGINTSDGGASGMDVNFNAVAGASGYQIYRADGNCSTGAKEFSYVGSSSTNNFTDALVVGGFDYAYKVRAIDACGEGPISVCDDGTSTAACPLIPQFDQASVVASQTSGDMCGVQLDWDAGQSECPGTGLRYNVYRSTEYDFVPGPGNLIAGDIGTNSYSDISVEPETTYFYVVRAEDTSDATDGNESLGGQTVKITPVASTSSPGVYFDGADDVSLMQLEGPWQLTDTQANTGSLSYHNAPDGLNYASLICAALTTPPIDLPLGSNPQLSYVARYNLEADWDGVVVEISTNGGASWQNLAPSEGYPGDFNRIGAPPVNACGYPASQGAFNGSSAGLFEDFSNDLSSFAGQTVMLRWNFSSDPGSEEDGFYLDDMQITDASVPNACFVGDELFMDGFEDSAP